MLIFERARGDKPPNVVYTKQYITNCLSKQPLSLSFFSWMHPGCRIDRVSLLGYGGGVLEERSGEVSMPNRGTERCCGCHRPLEQQTSSRTYQGIRDIAAHLYTVQLVIFNLCSYKIAFMDNDRPDLLRKVLLLPPQLSLLEHPSQWHSLHRARYMKIKIFSQINRMEAKTNEIAISYDEVEDLPGWTHQSDPYESCPHQWHSAKKKKWSGHVRHMAPGLILIPPASVKPNKMHFYFFN